MSRTAYEERSADSVRGSSSSRPDGETVLGVDDLQKTYGNGEEAVEAVEEFSLAVNRGEVVGLLGPNGAGKTTAIKSILGLVLPTEGSVEIAGVDARENPRTVYHHVGAMLEGARNVYWRLSVRENLEFFAALGGQSVSETRARHDRLLDRFSLTEKADETVKDLSRGQKQKVSLACTLARGTDVVFLDEPTLGLDVEAAIELQRELRRLAEEESVTILLSSHDMDVVETVCDRVVILSDGRIIADDQVEDLVGVFETQAYRVSVERPVPTAVRRHLTDGFDAKNWDERGDRVTFDVTLTDGDTLYDVLDVLRGAELALLDIDGEDPNLESVFLEVTGSDNGGVDR
ncbi:MAG: ABC-2 type transport system ATP-binding protein [Halobacteriales archaeon]|jgi:ABC-2 type transport system ATP-binding protein